ncbi:AraC family transcriptional regulator [Flavitalea sp. BT771]|uniref:AraC family transcriptional regulator n=1 Tax=Flavitalea sp. BT771 TaxID=3063329 RepID=UPI0026E12E1E|nr:AraC family transcriptional regulator [Flavitalea sp. BT771]MDO6430264.1 AraC family transcriptional regulator [Flavitalea sp. BT771]MDV6219596.1 AraC family transcriptional regulator [Flavitalea sp. BT771]
MKIIRTEISFLHNSRLSVLDRDEDTFNPAFHFHPELELVLIKQGYGRRIIGNRIDPFEKGDMVFVGSNLPHIWLNDDTSGDHRARSVVVHFRKEIFGQEFYELKESREVAHFFDLASRGIQVTGATRDKVSRKLDILVTLRGFRRVLLLLEILHILSTSSDVLCILGDTFNPENMEETVDRLSEVYKYVQNNFHKDISLRDIAGIAGLTPQSFCRFFKKKTSKHFFDYLNEVRIFRACEMLIESEAPVSEVAYYCGYNTISNFNKLFKESTGLTPGQFRIRSVVK